MQILNRFNRIVATSCIYALVVTLATPNAALAKNPKPLGWDNVLRLRHGDTVIVKLFSNQVHRGKVDKVEPNGIYISSEEGPLVLLKADVSSVDFYDRKKAAIIGTALMAGGVGLALTAETIGTVQDVSQLNNGQLTGSTGKHNLGLMIAGIGVAVGGLAVFAFGGRPKTIYKAKAPSPTSQK